MTATAQWSADPATRGVGTILLKGPNGGDVDLISTNAIRSGEIAAYIEMRDQVLVQAQAQLDQIAGALSRALSDRTVDGTPVSSGAQAGFDIDTGSLLDGNSVRLTYTDNTSGMQRTLTLIRVDDPAALPLNDSATTEPNDRVIGLDFSGGLAAVVSQLTSALSTSGLIISNPAGTTLRVLDDGGLNKVDVDALSATFTVTSLSGGTAELPFFLDGSTPFTAAIRSAGTQTVGLAGRIAVNASLMADASKLVVYQTSPATAAGDATRPNFIYDRLNSGALSYAPEAGVGTASAPFSGPLQAYVRQVISQQGEAAEAAANLKQGQDVVYNTLQRRSSEGAAVSIDDEMANLLNLQNAYAANARVLSTVKEMIEALMRM
jgi:flagellar hook-associated protein 1 FlgK